MSTTYWSCQPRDVGGVGPCKCANGDADVCRCVSAPLLVGAGEMRASTCVGCLEALFEFETATGLGVRRPKGATT